MKIDQTERRADRRTFRPFRRIGTVPGGEDMSEMWFARPGIHQYTFRMSKSREIKAVLEIGGRSPEVERDRWEIVGDIGRYNRVYLDSGACESHLRHVHTARDRPHSTKWSRMVPVGASLILLGSEPNHENRPN